MVVIFFDANCSFCWRQMMKLRRKDKHNVLSFEDINDPGLILEFYGLDFEKCTKEIHAVILNEYLSVCETYRGLDVYLLAHEKMGYKFPHWCRLPIIYQILQICYKMVSKVRKFL